MSKVRTVSYDRDRLEFEEVPKKKKKDTENYIWSTRRITLESYVCITLGLGSIYRFIACFVTHGGVVWLPYVLWSVFVAVPLITAHIALTQYSNGDMLYAWAMVPVAKGVFTNCLLSTFMYAMVTVLTLAFIILFSISLPTLSSSFVRACFDNNATRGTENYTFMVSSDQSESCRHLDILFERSWEPLYRGTDWRPYLYMGIGCLLTFVITCKGARSLEKFTTFLYIIAYSCAIICLILALTLPGSGSYIQKKWTIDWKELRSFEIWMVTLDHAIQGCQIGSFCITFVVVHGDFGDDIMGDVVMIILTQFINTLIFSLIVLGILGNLNLVTGIELKDFANSTNVKIILWILQGLEYLPPPKHLWSIILFTYLYVSKLSLLSFLIASMTGAVEAIFPKQKPNVFCISALCTLVLFVLGIPIIFYEVLELPSMTSSFVAVCLLKSITIFCIYNYRRVVSDFHFLMGYKPSIFYLITWLLSPFIFGAAVVLKIMTQTYLDFLVKNAFILTFMHVVVYIATGVYQFIGACQTYREPNIFKSNPNWGPADPIIKKSRIIFKSRIITKEHIYRQKLYKKQLIKPFDIKNQNIVQLI